MGRKTIGKIMIICMLISLSNISGAETLVSASEIKVNLISVNIVRKFNFYHSADDKSIDAAKVIEIPSNPMGGVSAITMINDKNKEGVGYTFLGGTVNIPDNVDDIVVIAEFEIKNIINNDVMFRIGDIIFRDNKGNIINISGIGKGSSIMVAKFTDLEKNTVKNMNLNIMKGEKETIKYLVGTEKGSLPLEYRYSNLNWKQLK